VTAAADHTATTTTVADLTEIREQWGDLLAAIGRRPRAEWPPRDSITALLTPAAEDGPAVGRLPLTLREHPAPLNLDALDAACAIERGLFDLADQIADATIPDPRDDDPARWHYPTVRDIGRASAASAGSRALGLHWCAVWIEDRLTQTEATALHNRVPAWLAERAAAVAADARDVLQRALGRDGRDTVLPAPCPWCRGELTARTRSGDPMAAVVTCGTGPTCGAPVPYDERARRHWRGADLVGLYAALAASERRATA
jgi:hypothetical protein